MKVSAKFPAANVRMPDELITWLRHKAVDNRRSLTSEIVLRLEQSKRTELEAGARK